MCGICGLVDQRENKTSVVDEALLKRMTAVIAHRGPDEDGFYLDRMIGLGMRRLSVIDLAGGHQPVHNEDKTIWTVFNGEIFNFKELRSQLQQQGHSFYTASDTEVIVHLYEEYSDKFVNKLRGMFAIALWDTQAEKFILARDRLGVKPVYYYEDSDAFFLPPKLNL